MDYFVHQNALCESENIGAGTRVWAFSHILPGARLGKNCNICDHVFIENDVIVGDQVTIKCGVQLWDGVELKNDVFVGPNVTFTNDRFPRSKQYPDQFSRTVVCERASIGANATILPGLIIGENAMIGAGSVVTRSVPAQAIVVGNPAKIVGYVEALNSLLEPAQEIPTVKPGAVQTPVKGVALYNFKVVPDMRGNLSVGEFEREIPFTPRRYFLVYDVPTAETRGEHAHRKCHQFLIALKGSVRVVADDGERRVEVNLDRANLGLYLPPMTWGTQYRYSSDAMLLVFASDYYDATDYIRDYSEFVEAIKIEKRV